jgi:hypothetical protein
VAEAVVDVPCDPVTLLCRRQPLRLHRVRPKPRVSRRQLAPGLLFPAQQFGDHRGERHGGERAQALAQAVTPRHADVQEWNQRNHDGDGGQRNQQHALAHQHHEQQRGAHTRARHREEHEAEHQLDRDVPERQRRSPRPVHPLETRSGEESERRAQRQGRGRQAGTRHTDHDREECTRGQDGQGALHDTTVNPVGNEVNALSARAPRRVRHRRRAELGVMPAGLEPRR